MAVRFKGPPGRPCGGGNMLPQNPLDVKPEIGQQYREFIQLLE
jgi:hypothetical protein